MQQMPEEQPPARKDRIEAPHTDAHVSDADFHEARVHEADLHRVEWERFEAGWRQYEGQQAARAAVRLGLIGIFVLGIVLGPMALHRVWRAETFGARPVAGEILGWVATSIGLVHLTIALLLLSPGGPF